MNSGWFSGIDRDRQAGDFAELSARKSLIVMQEMLLCDISVITTKVPCGVSLMSERHVCIENLHFVMQTFVQRNGRQKAARRLP